MKSIASFLIACIFFLACKKDHSNDTKCIHAEVVWGGDPAADGLGWHLVDSLGGLTRYFPDNLPDSLQIDGLSVDACLYKTNALFLCECAGPVYKHHLTSIKRH